jgi:hypothetical protein
MNWSPLVTARRRNAPGDATNCPNRADLPLLIYVSDPSGPLRHDCGAKGNEKP